MSTTIDVSDFILTNPNAPLAELAALVGGPDEVTEHSYAVIGFTGCAGGRREWWDPADLLRALTSTSDQVKSLDVLVGSLAESAPAPFEASPRLAAAVLAQACLRLAVDTTNPDSERLALLGSVLLDAAKGFPLVQARVTLELTELQVRRLRPQLVRNGRAARWFSDHGIVFTEELDRDGHRLGVALADLPVDAEAARRAGVVVLAADVSVTSPGGDLVPYPADKDVREALERSVALLCARDADLDLTSKEGFAAVLADVELYESDHLAWVTSGRNREERRKRALNAKPDLAGVLMNRTDLVGKDVPRPADEVFRTLWLYGQRDLMTRDELLEAFDATPRHERILALRTDGEVQKFFTRLLVESEKRRKAAHSS